MIRIKTLSALTLAVFLSSLSAMAEAAKPFVHPGMLHSRAELAFIKGKISSGEEPWKSAWEQLHSAKSASLTYRPNAKADVVRGVRNRPDIGSSNMSNDAAAAYAHALQWSLTGEQAHAEKAIEILNAWSATLKSVGGHDAKLLIGMDGISFCNAAELIRHTSDRWKPGDQKKFEQMLREIFYPIIKDFYSTANGNWDASMIQTMMAMGIFLDDRAMFERATNYFRSGKGNGAITNYLNHFGECQESGRDQVHTQMGLGYLSCACEMAWKQDVDLYSAANHRLALGFEYTAKYNLGEDVPFEPFQSVEGRYNYQKISRKSRGRFRPIYERTLHHYRDRMGIAMPCSQKVAEAKRPESPHIQHISWGTLMHYGLPGGQHLPVVLGKGAGLFEVGPLLFSDDFKNLDHWLVQIEQKKKAPAAKVTVKDQSLDCFLPSRGATIWFKQKLKTRVTISYDVLCPSSPKNNRNFQPTDINNFWMASDPGGDLFDAKKYTGSFSTYDQMHGYYASTGGGKNTTTRMRRYPRSVNGNPVDHPALNARDGSPDYLITPDKLMRIQLVAYDDVIQYIVDGKLVYEMSHGDAIQLESRDADGKRIMIPAKYTHKRFPIFKEGYFGFRMVGTHHIYSNFKVHTLTPAVMSSDATPKKTNKK